MSRHLEGVKPGDTIKCARPLDHVEELFPVEAVVGAIAQCARSAWFRIDSGRMIHATSSRYGYIATADDIARITQETAIRCAQAKLSKFTVTADNLAAVESLLAQGSKA